MFDNLNSKFNLYNGVEIPCVGFGTYKTPDGQICSDSVKTSIECGYRHIDTASFYANEKGVGEGIIQSGIKREDVFVTTKLWNDMQGYENTIKSFNQSLQRLNLDYLDLFLIHWPNPKQFRNQFPNQLLDTWKAFETLYKDGKVRSIGVCNCLKEHLDPLFNECEIKPMVNQIECHIGYKQFETVEYSKSLGMVVEAWSPLCKAKVFDHPLMVELSNKYGKSPAQILIKWCLTNDVLPLPKSITPSRIEQNAKVFDFQLEIEDIQLLNAFDECDRLGSHPNTADF